MKKRITVTISSQLLQEVREIAEERGESISEFVEYSLRHSYGIGMRSSFSELLEKMRKEAHKPRDPKWEFLKKKLGARL